MILCPAGAARAGRFCPSLTHPEDIPKGLDHLTHRLTPQSVQFWLVGDLPVLISDGKVKMLTDSPGWRPLELLSGHVGGPSVTSCSDPCCFPSQN